MRNDRRSDEERNYGKGSGKWRGGESGNYEEWKKYYGWKIDVWNDKGKDDRKMIWVKNV